MTRMIEAYRQAVAKGALRSDPGQVAAAEKLDRLCLALAAKPGFFLFRRVVAPPRGLYIWGEVGRGKTMLMDLFFASAPLTKKRRVHFNSFMVDTHARIHAMRQQAGTADPIAPVARELAAGVQLLCFDEFQVTDVADAMILGRLFEALFAQDIAIVATSNTAPERLYEGGLNRQLFLPFIDEIKQRLDVVALNGPTDYRMQVPASALASTFAAPSDNGTRTNSEVAAGIKAWMTPLSPQAEADMNTAWQRLTGTRAGRPVILTVLGRKLVVPQAARGVARFSFAELCDNPLAAADYLAITQNFRTVLIDHIPQMTPDMRNQARRFVLLVDTLYDEGVRLIASAATSPAGLYPQGDGAEAFRRTVSRLAEMQGEDYLIRRHAIHGLS